MYIYLCGKIIYVRDTQPTNPRVLVGPYLQALGRMPHPKAKYVLSTLSELTR